MPHGDPTRQAAEIRGVSCTVEMMNLGSLSKEAGVPRWRSSQESACQCRRRKKYVLNPCVRKISWRRKWQPTPVFLPGKSYGQRRLVGYSPWGCKESDTTEHAQKKHINLKRGMERKIQTSSPKKRGERKKTKVENQKTISQT